jgi:hypothetical protein
MSGARSENVVSVEQIAEHLHRIRGQSVMLDAGLAALYGVETRVLIQAVRRNPERFPDDFMFQLSKGEFNDLRSQTVISSWGGRRYAFTQDRIGFDP